MALTVICGITVKVGKGVVDASGPAVTKILYVPRGVTGKLNGAVVPAVEIVPVMIVVPEPSGVVAVP
jgi:hypothetical protein